MARYAVLFSLTSQSAKAFIANPSDRQAAVSAIIEPAGGHVEAYYWMFGPYDGLLIYDVPDSASAAAVALAVSASGALKSYQTCELFASDELAAIAQKAAQGAAVYRPPGQ